MDKQENIIALLNEQLICSIGNIDEISQCLDAIIADNKGSADKWAMFRAYTLGYINGKRAERARRNKGRE